MDQIIKRRISAARRGLKAPSIRIDDFLLTFTAEGVAISRLDLFGLWSPFKTVRTFKELARFIFLEVV